jgi:hypothetical protein
MPRSHSSIGSLSGTHGAADVQTDVHVHGRALTCALCTYGLECVEQNRRSGSWVGSFICPNCRSEYLYSYRWGRLSRKS